MNKKGFTLIELIMVIVIIGILAAVAIPQFVNLQDQARKAVCQANVGSIRTGLTNWYAQYQLRMSNSSVTACPTNTSTDCSSTGYPAAAQLNSLTSFFGQNYFADQTMPDNESMTGTAGTWGDSAHYNATTGGLNMTACCG